MNYFAIKTGKYSTGQETTKTFRSLLKAKKSLVYCHMFEPERSHVEVEDLVKDLEFKQKIYSSKTNTKLEADWCICFKNCQQWWRKRRVWAAEKEMTSWMSSFKEYSLF